MKLHPSLTEARIVRAVKADNGTGFCSVCGKKCPEYVEPDADGAPYPDWEARDHVHTVYGAEQLLLMTVA